MCDQYRFTGFMPSTLFPQYIQVECHTIIQYNTEACTETAEWGYASLHSLCQYASCMKHGEHGETWNIILLGNS